MAWRNSVDKLVLWVKKTGGTALVGMMLVTVFDVATRAAGTPIFGMVEIVSLLAVIVLACAMPMTHVENGHVGVGLLVNRWKPRNQTIMDIINGLVSTALFAVVSWQMFLYGNTMKKSGEVSMSLQLPTYLLIYVVALAFGVLALVILVGTINSFQKVGRS